MVSSPAKKKVATSGSSLSSLSSSPERGSLQHTFLLTAPVTHAWVCGGMWYLLQYLQLLYQGDLALHGFVSGAAAPLRPWEEPCSCEAGSTCRLSGHHPSYSQSRADCPYAKLNTIRRNASGV